MGNAFLNYQLQRIAEGIEGGMAGGGTLTVDVTGAGDMQGATASTDGVHGLVPQPMQGDQDKYLSGGGTWKTIPTIGGIPDYSNIITSGNYNTYDGFIYTATQDCFICIMIGCASAQSYPDVIINNNNIGYIWGQTSGVESLITIPLRSGDSLEITAVNAGGSWSEKYTIFGY